MTDKDTDDTDEPTRDELESRVEQLEQTVQQMLPSRRDALKLGGTALAAGALGSAATGSASAGTNSVGTIGSASSPVDAELEDVNPGSVRAVNFNNNDITNVSSLSTDKVNTSGGYDWQDKTSSRSFDTWERAPSDRDIWISVDVTATSDNVEVSIILNINDSQSQNRVQQVRVTVDTAQKVGIGGHRIPAGHYYKVGKFNSGYALNRWVELR